MGDSENIFDLKMNIELNTDQNGNKYYIIPVGTKIYRGGYPADMHPNAFFGFNPDHVKQYGSVTEYTIKDELKVLAIMEMDTSSDFYTKNTEIQDALVQSYSYSNTKKIRDSIPAYDYAVVNHICKKRGYDGYAMHDKYTSDSGGTFHAELVICNCYDRVEQGEKGEQAPPRVMRKVKQTNFYFVEEEKLSPASSPFGTPTSESLVSSPIGTPPGESLFSSPIGTPQEGILGRRLEKTLETPNGFIPFNLYSPDTKSPLKLILEEEDKSKARSMLFGSPQQDPNKLKTKYNSEGMKDTTVQNLDFGGGKRKTKRRNRKTKNKTKRRRNRRTRKGGLFKRNYTIQEIINYIDGLYDIYLMQPPDKIDILNTLENIQQSHIEACTSFPRKINKECEERKIDDIYEPINNIIKQLINLPTDITPDGSVDENMKNRLERVKEYFTNKQRGHSEKIGDYTIKNTMTNTTPKLNSNDINENAELPDYSRLATTNRKAVGIDKSPIILYYNPDSPVSKNGGKRKTKRRKTRTKSRRKRTKKVKH
jgi:hypothetical protein